LGLAETLKGRLAWEKAVRPTGTKNLCVLPAGRLTAPPAAGGDSRLTTLLAELSSRFEFVLVDAGPLVENDAAAVAEAARDIYFVVRLGESQQRSTAAAVQKLQAGRARLRGCVVTNA
ncbi:MAG: hypothetical protein KDA41_10805, partial [Planctomycetales bacterium]|nr:hypothetical protein [Planctomycetales bacterium]